MEAKARHSLSLVPCQPLPEESVLSLSIGLALYLCLDKRAEL